VKPWCMLATPFSEVSYIVYPVIVQPKLNGIRAKWTGAQLISRQNKLWRRELLPYVYDKLLAFSADNPGVVLDGELYCHGIPFQEIERWTAVNRINPHDNNYLVEYHAFDIISTDLTEQRLTKLAGIYDQWVPVAIAKNEESLQNWLIAFRKAGYEGLMARCLNVPYLVGRTEALIKLKPWITCAAKIVGFSPGKDKYTGMLGALVVEIEGNKVFNVSGGLTDELREKIWKQQAFWVGRSIHVRYRDLYNSGVPVHPQIARLE
jgi:DNA ligase 1